LIYTFADVGSKFHNRGGKVGDIRPENVFINEDGQLKVATKHSWPQEMDNYQKAFYEK
jgi:DNA-binding helix-hairpin-helix protein with protein kinase domain